MLLGLGAIVGSTLTTSCWGSRKIRLYFKSVNVFVMGCISTQNISFVKDACFPF
jgi:hypothetical protein